MRHFLRKKTMQISVLNCVIWFMLCDCMDLLLLRHGCEVNVALLLIYAAFLLENYKNIILVGCWSLFFFCIFKFLQGPNGVLLFLFDPNFGCDVPTLWMGDVPKVSLVGSAASICWTSTLRCFILYPTPMVVYQWSLNYGFSVWNKVPWNEDPTLLNVYLLRVHRKWNHSDVKLSWMKVYISL